MLGGGREIGAACIRGAAPFGANQALIAAMASGSYDAHERSKMPSAASWNLKNDVTFCKEKRARDIAHGYRLG